MYAHVRCGIENNGTCGAGKGKAEPISEEELVTSVGRKELGSRKTYRFEASFLA